MGSGPVCPPPQAAAPQGSPDARAAWNPASPRNKPPDTRAGALGLGLGRATEADSTMDVLQLSGR